MSNVRTKFTGVQKSDILRRHLKDKVSGQYPDRRAIDPSDQAKQSFDRLDRGAKSAKKVDAKIADLKEQRIKKLEEKLIYKKKEPLI
ncbi:MAG: hypothetical protein ABL921_13825 [Pirellula sp.]